MRLSTLPRRSMIVMAATAMVVTSGGIVSAQGEAGGCPPMQQVVASPIPSSSPVSGTPTATVADTAVRFGETDALLWRAGDDGVILSHGAAYDAASWRPQAEAMAAAGRTVLALEQNAPEDILAAAQFLRQECGVDQIALIGASAGASTALGAATVESDAFEQLIILSGSGDVSGLGELPKLFVASEEEGLADATRQMAEDAPGSDNEAIILPGAAHAQEIFTSDQGSELLQAILDRLHER